MKNIYEIIKKNILFDNINYEDFEKMSQCLEVKTQNYKKRRFYFTGWGFG